MVRYDISRLLELTKNQSRGGATAGTEGIRSVFVVMVVDPRSAKIVLKKEVVAKDEGEARLRGLMGENIGDLDKMDIGCTCVISDFVRPRKETQKVTISKEDDRDN